MEDKIRKLFDELHTKMRSENSEGVNDIIEELKTSWDTYHEQFKLGFSDFDENIKKKFDPLLQLSKEMSSLELKVDRDLEKLDRETLEKINSLKESVSVWKNNFSQRIDENFEKDRNTREFVDENRKFIEDNREDLTGVSALYHRYKHTSKMLIGIGVLSFGGILTAGYFSLTGMIDREKSEIKEAAKQEKKDIEEIIENSLQESVIISRSSKIILNRLSENFLLGNEHRAHTYLNDSLYNIEKIISSNNYNNYRFFRINELKTFLNFYRSRHSQYRKEYRNFVECEEGLYQHSRMKIANAVYSWTVGNLKAALNSLDSAWDMCRIPENRYLYYWLYSTINTAGIEKFQLDDINNSLFDLSEATKIYDSEKTDFPPARWLRLIATIRLLELNSLSYDAFDKNIVKLREQEAKNIAKHLNLSSAKDYQASFSRLYRESGVDFRVKNIAAHYLHYINWKKSTGLPSSVKYTLESRVYVSQLVEILSVWPTFIKVKNNLVDRFHPCMIRLKPAKGVKNSLCEKLGISGIENMEAPYFAPIEDLKSWIKYLDDFYKMFSDYPNFRINHSLLVSHFNIKEYVRHSSLALDQQSHEMVNYNFDFLLRKICHSNTIVEDLRKIRGVTPDRFKKLMPKIEQYVMEDMQEDGSTDCVGRDSSACVEAMEDRCPLIAKEGDAYKLAFNI